MLLLSMDADRLVLFCGAGMSRGDPTNLPSAAGLAAQLAGEYEQAQGGKELAENLHEDLEAFAKHVYAERELNAQLIQKVPWEDFRRNPNPAHDCAADLLLTKATRAVVSTNYDSHIEDAAMDLGERGFFPALDGDQADRLPGRYRPLLKIHGCVTDRENTVWLVDQLEVDPIKSRHERTQVWAASNLRQRDLLFLGFWSDWAYLNEIFGRVLRNVETPDARKVIVVDPARPAELEAKAGDLWEWAANSESVEFLHVQAKAEVFMAELRTEVGHQFLRNVLREGRDTYQELSGERPVEGPLGDGMEQSAKGLYNLRRDLTGSAPHEPVTTIRPEGLALVGAILMRLLQRGATIEGPVIRLDGQSLRLVKSNHQLLSTVRSHMESGDTSGPRVDRIVCVGAVDTGAASNVVRDGRRSSVARPGLGGSWETVEPLLGEIFEIQEIA